MSGRRFLGGLAVLVHLLLGVFPYLASALLAPAEGVLLLMAIWAVLLVAGLWLWRRRPLFAWLAPLAAITIWPVIVLAGDEWFGWTA